MTAQQLLVENIRFCHMLTREYLSNLSDEDLMRRPAPGANHIAWQLGHLIGSEQQMMAATGAKMPELPADFNEHYTKETANSDDPTKFHDKATYLKLMDKMHEASIAAIEAAPDERLSEPAPEPMRAYVPTIGMLYLLIGNHEMMHNGQFVPVRRMLGKPHLF